MGRWRAARLIATLIAVTAIAVAAVLVVAKLHQPACAVDCATAGIGSFGPTAVPSSTPLSSAGDWTGLFVQSNGPRYAIRVELGPQFAPAVVSYPELRCSGSWTMTNFDGSSWTFSEHIAAGKCTGDGIIHLRWAADGDLLLDYQATVDNYTARATLSRGPQ